MSSYLFLRLLIICYQMFSDYETKSDYLTERRNKQITKKKQKLYYLR